MLMMATYTALAMCTSYLAAAIRREPRCRDADVRKYVRRKQRLRTVALERASRQERDI